MSLMAGHPSGKSSCKDRSLHWMQCIFLAVRADDVSRGRALEKEQESDLSSD